MRRITIITAFFILAVCIHCSAFAECGGFIIDPADMTAVGYTGLGGAAAVPSSIRRLDFISSADKAIEAITEIILHAGITGVNGLSECKSLAEISVDAENPMLKSVDGVLYTKDMTCLIAYPRAKKDAVFKIPETVVKIQMGAVTENPYLEAVVFPAGLAELGTGNFTSCGQLKSLTMPEENASYTAADGLLYTKDEKCLKLCPGGISGRVTVREGTEVIGYSAFSGCSSMTETVLPESLLSIMTMAFSGCTGLKSITLPAGLESLNVSCFSGCMALTAIEAGNSDRYKSVDGILYSRDMLDLICCPPGKSGSVTIPRGVRSIQNGAFDGCSQITEIRLPWSMENIERAFLNCAALTCLQVPETQSILDYCTFMGCTKLEWVYLPCNVVIIQDRAFEGCNPVIYCDEDSYAEMYAMEHGLEYRYMIHVLLNGEKVWFDQPPVMERNAVLVPVRAVFEALGAEVSWDEKTKSAVAESNGTQVEITADKEQMQIKKGTDTREVTLSASAKIENGRMLVPLRAVAEAFMAEVSWNMKTNTVEIVKNENNAAEGKES